MSDPHHFRAFSFVDRITAVQPGVSVRGTYTVPEGITEFSNSLVGEATGQLAAWSAMAAVDFKSRPVAGIAGLIEVLGHVMPGQTLELVADIETVDTDAIAYGGSASVNGSPVLRLRQCVGPMLGVGNFDDPQALRDRYALLCGSGATPGAYGGLPPIILEEAAGDPGKVARANLQVPASAPFFDDHFPRRPVFPGSLLMQYSLQLVHQLAAQWPVTAGAAWKLRNVSDMKLRAFISPGELLALEVKLEEQTADTAKVSVESRRNKKLAGVATVTLGCG